MSRIDTELGRIRKVLQRNYKDMPGRAEELERQIKADVARGNAEMIIGNFVTPELVPEERRVRIFFLVKTLPLPQKHSVKVIFQTIEDKENQELLHLLHKKTRV